MTSDSWISKWRRSMQKVQVKRSWGRMAVETMVKLSSSMWSMVQTTPWYLESIKWLSCVALCVSSPSFSPAWPLWLFHKRRTSWILLWISTRSSLTKTSTLSILSLWLESITHASIVVVSTLLLILVINRHQ